MLKTNLCKIAGFLLHSFIFISFNVLQEQQNQSLFWF